MIDVKKFCAFVIHVYIPTYTCMDMKDHRYFRKEKTIPVLHCAAAALEKNKILQVDSILLLSLQRAVNLSEQ